MATRCKLQNVSSSFEEKYKTSGGDVIVTRLKRSLWSVHERGRESFLVRSKATAFSEACGIVERRRRR